MANAKRTNLQCRAWAILLAVAFHMIALVLMGWQVPGLVDPAKRQDDNMAMAVFLVRLPIRVEVPRRAEAPKSSPLAPDFSTGVITAPAPPLNRSVENVPTPPLPQADPDGQHVRNALRGLMGCAAPGAFDLRRDEQMVCDQRLAVAKPAPVGSSLSAEELAQFDPPKQGSILTRKLHNDCLPRLYDRPAPAPTRSGKTTTFGLGCALSF
jgi:hypothetical protein